jgi:hypothetical protein
VRYFEEVGELRVILQICDCLGAGTDLMFSDSGLGSSSSTKAVSIGDYIMRGLNGIAQS